MAANLGPLYLASYLADRGGDVEVLIKDRIEDLAPFAPEILGVSSVTENIEAAKEIARNAKSLWNPVTVLGGVHITALPDSLPRAFDIGVIGEGEETTYQLVQLFLQGKIFQPKALKQVPGIVFHAPEGVYRSAPRKGPEVLDHLPPPDRKKYIKHEGVTYMMTSRGCPYTCNFCVIPTVMEGYRKFSPEYVVRELKSIKESFPDVKHVRIFDDLFIVDRPRVAKIAQLVRAEGLDREMALGCWVRANLLDKDVLESFKMMNMKYAGFGAESGSSRVLGQIKPGCSLEQNQEAIDRLHQEGILAGCSIILGHPTETEDDLWATLEFLEKNFSKLYEVEMNVAIPWPGTDLWDQAKRKGIVHENMDFNSLKECASLPNYSTEEYPYLNEKIPAERFDDILDEFKRLYWKMAKRNRDSELAKIVNPLQDIARYH